MTKLCVKDVCETWSVTKLCDKNGVRKSCVCRSAISATPATQNEGGCRQVPCLPRKAQVDATKCRACHAKVPRRHARPSGPQCANSPISATPATQNEGGCHQVSRLPRKAQVDVTKCCACHAKVPRRHARPRGPNVPSAPPDPAQSHTKRRWMSPSATPAKVVCERWCVTKLCVCVRVCV